MLATVDINSESEVQLFTSRFCIFCERRHVQVDIHQSSTSHQTSRYFSKQSRNDFSVVVVHQRIFQTCTVHGSKVFCFCSFRIVTTLGHWKFVFIVGPGMHTSSVNARSRFQTDIWIYRKFCQNRWWLIWPRCFMVVHSMVNESFYLMDIVCSVSVSQILCVVFTSSILCVVSQMAITICRQENTYMHISYLVVVLTNSPI